MASATLPGQPSVAVSSLGTVVLHCPLPGVEFSLQEEQWEFEALLTPSLGQGWKSG